MEQTKPFDVEFGAVFAHSGGEELDLPGFYDGQNTWIIRFCQAIEGKWTYQTYSSLKPLDNQTGQVKVLPNKKENRHGSVKISKENPQRFVYEDKTPYFPLAFEIDWLFALDAENNDGIPRTRQMMSSLTEHGFNKVIMNVYAYDAYWGERDKNDPKYYFSEPEVFPFGGSNQEPDQSVLNIDFFKHFDRVMQHLHENEVVSHLMIYVWNKFVNWPQPGSEKDNKYFDYVVKRYQAFPKIIWDISKETLAYGMDDMDYIVGRIQRLEKLDAYNRLLTVHDYKFCRSYPDLVDFISVQEWRPNLYNEMQNIVEEYPDKPVFNVEHGGYEQTMHQIFHGAYIDPVVCLEGSYICLFAGTYTTYYWQNTSWYEVVYEPFSLPLENQPRFVYYKHLSDFFELSRFSSLQAKQFFYSPYCPTNNEDTWIYLVTSGMYALEGMAPRGMKGNKVEIEWFNPLTGEFSQKQIREVGEWTGFKKPDSVTSPFSIVVVKKSI